MNRLASPCNSADRQRAFTLLELLVVMGILLVLAVLTTVSVSKVTRDAQLSGATNTVVAALGNARAIAVRDSAYVMVTFRVAADLRDKFLPSNPPTIEVVTARWTGEVIRLGSPNNGCPAISPALPDDTLADRFLPIPGVPVRALPRGVSVAGPAFGYVTDGAPGDHDDEWRSLPRFGGQVVSGPVPCQPPGVVGRYLVPDLSRTEAGWGLAVLFGPDGRALSRNPEQVLEVVTGAGNQNAYVKAFVDFNADGYPQAGTSNARGGASRINLDFFVYDEPTDEVLVDYVPYLAVFSESELRSKFSDAEAAAWRGPFSVAGGFGNDPPQARVLSWSRFIEEQSDRITFNRFTGVAGVLPR
jgi:prepilin-type N-terminal cleavage/methylation domain-containing protein